MADTFYSILGVSRDVTSKEIKKAYRKLALETHPDRNESADAQERFIEIHQAYLILTDEDARAKYDAKLNQSESEESQPNAHHYKSTNGQYRSPSQVADEVFNSWVRNAREQAYKMANLNYGEFKEAIAEVGVEVAHRFLKAVVFALSGFFGASSLFAFISGIANGNPANILLGAVAGILCLGSFTLLGNSFY